MFENAHLLEQFTNKNGRPPGVAPAGFLNAEGLFLGGESEGTSDVSGSLGASGPVSAAEMDADGLFMTAGRASDDSAFFFFFSLLVFASGFAFSGGVSSVSTSSVFLVFSASLFAFAFPLGPGSPLAFDFPFALGVALGAGAGAGSPWQ